MMIPEELEPAKSAVIELKEGHNYLICIDDRKIRKEDVNDLLNRLHEGGVNFAIALMVAGDPRTAVKVIEEKPDAKE